MTSKLDNSNISRHLGQTSSYKSIYDSSLIVREPRQANRTHLNIQDDDLPFTGTDTWNAYEVSGLTNSGVPVAGIAKIVYSCTNKYIVESKSLKLYFNSFNMTKLGESSEEVRKTIQEMAARDLSRLLETDVEVRVFSNREVLDDTTTAHQEWFAFNNTSPVIEEFITLEDDYPFDELEISKYSESPELLEVIDSEKEITLYHSSLLKSNCRVTSQPDFGDVFIHIKGSKTIEPASMLKYIISFRDECHFHEEICETIYTRLWNLLKPAELVVRCLYTRRGGIDICPERASEPKLQHFSLNDTTVAYIKTPRQ